MTHRHCIIVEGDRQVCHYTTRNLLAEFEQSNVLYVGEQPFENAIQLPVKKAATQLGKEFDAVVVDGHDGVNADVLGILIGLVVSGGVFIVLLTEESEHSLWLKRYKRIFKYYAKRHASFQYIVAPDSASEAISIPRVKSNISNTRVVTDDQQDAIDAVLKVVSGHRRRPLVLTADRGRGKSSALGIAAAQLLLMGKQRIVVTAPSFATVKILFQHAAEHLIESVQNKHRLIYGSAEISYMAPDALLDSLPQADLLIVDEAAAIPVYLLQRLLQHYSRVAFSSTEHGYEGSGRGFSIRFHSILNSETPNWNYLHISTPIRWHHDDPLEAFSFDALLLNAEPVEDKLVMAATPEHCQFEQLSAQYLIDHETDLRALFGLMVLAHYRTRPSDCQMLLDREDISIYVMRFNGHIIAAALCVNEGDIAPDLAEAIYAGERRLKGHLLPQSLLAHAGVTKAGNSTYLRVIRLTVHPVIQQRGIGHACMDHIIREGKTKQHDVIGVSFAASSALIHFWSLSDFKPIRLGLHQDDVSGSNAIMMLRALSEDGQLLVEEAFKDFSADWPFLLQQQFQQLSPQLAIVISQLLPQVKRELSSQQRNELSVFAHKQRSYDACRIQLWRALNYFIHRSEFLLISERQQALCILLIMQNRPLADVVKTLSYTGKKQLFLDLKSAISELLEHI